MKKFLKTITIFFIAIVLIGNTYINVQNRLNMGLLIETQEVILHLQNFYNELNVQRNSLLEEKVDQKLGEVQKEVKPSFEYMKSVTVRMLNITNPKTGMGSVGTGTIIKVTEDYTYVLTNRHVAPLGSQFLYIEKDGVRYKGRVLKNGITRDLSLVRMVGKIPNTSVVKGFAETKEQDKIYSVGMYLGLYDIYTEGTVAGWTDGSRLMNMPCLNGCSGSGVFDKDGNMVAVLYAGNRYNMFGFDTAKAICVPYIGIMAFLEEIL